MPTTTGTNAVQESAVALYNYLKELSALKLNSIVNIDDYQWKLYVSELLSDTENITISYRDRTEDETPDDEIDPTIVKIHKPEHQKCPDLPASITTWVEPGWDDFHQKVSVVSVKKDEKGSTISFDLDEQRVSDFEEWHAKRMLWQEKQLIIENTRKLFMSLYTTYIDVNRESETMEVVIADGFLRDKKNKNINHPLITRRVSISFDAADNTLAIEDLDVETELYTLLLRELNGIDSNAVSQINDELRSNDYHPLDRNDTPDFLKASIHKLSAESLFSSKGIPEKWEEKNRFLVYSEPIFIFRKRVDGTARFIQNIIDKIMVTGVVPAPIAETVKGGKISVPERDHDLSIEEQLAAVGGEDVDILLSKEANKEQLEIAQRIELYNGVLVQGPPGTGKTHTIANLLGHFLAQGKSVLVTSQTPKALQVLKDKLPDNIKPLCVSVLNDKNIDMERSVDGITSFMAHNTSSELLRDSQILKQDRETVIRDLGLVRKKIFSIINTESNNIIINGEEISPSKAASFVLNNQNSLAYIPGRVKVGVGLPLTYAELIDLYHSNATIDCDAERELGCELPNPIDVISPAEFTETVEEFNQFSAIRDNILSNKSWTYRNIKDNQLVMDIGSKELEIILPEKEKLETLSDYVRAFEEMEDWMKYAAIDGQRGGAYSSRWNKLIEKIEDACKARETYIEASFGREIEYQDIDALINNEAVLRKLFDIYERKGKLTKIDLITNRTFEPALKLATVNGAQPQNKEDFAAILQAITLEQQLHTCAKFWNELIGKHGSTKFEDLDQFEPEQVAKRWIDSIRHNLSWYSSVLDEVDEQLAVIGISVKNILVIKKEDSALQITEKVLSAMSTVVPQIVNICRAEKSLACITNEWNDSISILKAGRRISSAICQQIIESIKSRDTTGFQINYHTLEEVYQKYYLQKVRGEYLERLALVAPDWAEAIKNRIGVHGENAVPSDIEDAWKWKQYNGVLSDILSTPYDELQTESINLSKKYRELTSQYAEKMAWYYLLSRTECDIDMRQALNGWKLTVRKIGKGTGKNAPKLKAQARKLMASCQNAVPAWIMPMSRVIESLDPRENQFDVVIVDEASQSDVTALGVLYLGKKVIIVGDDKQVSPMAIGTEQEKMDALEQMYIRGIIPNSHLFGATTSLYDIAATTYQPLMLREHFRCVPAIIGFSNGLSYDYKIKPLRDAGSSSLLPAVINYRVNGERQGKKNMTEAETIVSLIKACLSQKEYENKTFGVISLLGDEQAKVISQLLFKHLEPQEIERHQILCGNPSHFQGDERDVIFLSVIDSPREGGPLSKQEFGAGEAIRKRYNVAASRAKDQLWVVDSLDAANDLKPGDIRRRLIEYSLNPTAAEEMHNEIVKNADSPFEISVADALVQKGYKITQQVPVGAYRLDIVAICGNNHVAVECDGERFHSGEAKIREDMERQTILERSGWRFIRIRGSEYYRNPDEAIQRVVKELHALGIEPSLEMENERESNSELLERVKTRAAEYLEEIKQPVMSNRTISAALNSCDKRVITPSHTQQRPIRQTLNENVEYVNRQVSIFDVEKEIKTIENSTINKNSLCVGAVVVSDLFGKGTVISIKKEQKITLVRIDFNGKLKTLSADVFSDGRCKIVGLPSKESEQPRKRTCEDCYWYIRDMCGGLRNPNECKDYKEKLR